jgi:DNA-binding NarL/FixJ family response regulator
MSGSMIRVLLIEPFEIISCGLRIVLEDARDIEPVRTTASAHEALTLVSTLAPDVVITNLHMADMDAIELIHRLAESVPPPRILVIALENEAEYVEAALAAGALGFMFVSLSTTELVNAVYSLYQGIPAFCSQAAQTLIQMSHSTHRHSNPDTLTVRENEVLALLSEGLSNPDIAARLSVSPFTVKNHVSNILGKLGVSTRTEAVALAFRSDIVKVPLASSRSGLGPPA